tara:strand:- start:7550 stop:8443 length:894 start_codon:yes stop_codon:yes gene_type:complete
MKVYLAGPHAYKNIFDMKVYLATPHTYDVGKLYSDNMKIYLAEAQHGETQKAMDVYLAGLSSRPFVLKEQDKICVLESFYYIKDWMIPYIQNEWNFLLDSGAFTFMNDKKNNGNINWNEYTEKYADFINKNNIDLFFELDIDSIIGIKNVEKLRTKLEKLTNKQCIPVWHKTRGKKYWEKMIKEYDYVAIGGLVSNVKYKNKIEKYFPYFIKTAKENNCKVHALGYTSVKSLKKYPFYSVDSTSWIQGNRGGFLYKFTGNNIIQINKPQNTRLKAKKTAIHNFNEWVKFQKYAEKNM